MSGRSISSRLTIWFSSVYFIGLALFGTAMWFNLEHTLTTARSRTLERRADRLIEVLTASANDPLEQREKKFKTFADATGGGLMEVFHPDGTRALSSPGAIARSFPWPVSTVPETDKFSEATTAGQKYFVLERPWQSPFGPVILHVAAPLENNIAVLRTFRDGMLWILPALLAFSAFGGYFLSRGALRPVDAITAATRSISVMNLSGRLPIPSTNDELQRLTETCNDMLARIESAVGEIKRFTADASHELRTPLSVIRTVAELGLRNPSADPESHRAFVEIVDEASRTSRLLEEMLLLARADDGSARLNFEPIDLAEVIRVVGAKARRIAESHGHRLTVDTPAVELPLVRGDYSTLQRLLWILLDNAMKYTTEPGRIEIALHEANERLVLTVKDTGVGIAPGDLPHIFERFYRADRSRSRIEGSGLGLTIARWIADVHQAELTVESEEHKGAAFRAAFPIIAAQGNNQTIPLRNRVTSETL